MFLSKFWSFFPLDTMITYTTATPADLPSIITLQSANLKENLSLEEVKEQGYVTVVHDLALLEEMNRPHPHIIAKDGGEVVGYALVMTLEMRDRIPILVDMILEIDQTKYQGELMKGKNYVIVGQVCVAKGYRGQGVFSDMYSYYKKVMQPHFDYIVTGISMDNARSLNAHKKCGFEILSVFEDQEGRWANVIFDLTKSNNRG